SLIQRRSQKASQLGLGRRSKQIDIGHQHVLLPQEADSFGDKRSLAVPSRRQHQNVLAAADIAYKISELGLAVGEETTGSDIAVAKWVLGRSGPTRHLSLQ